MKTFTKRVASVVAAATLSLGTVAITVAPADAMDSSWGRGTIVAPSSSPDAPQT